MEWPEPLDSPTSAFSQEIKESLADINVTQQPPCSTNTWHGGMKGDKGAVAEHVPARQKACCQRGLWSWAITCPNLKRCPASCNRCEDSCCFWPVKPPPRATWPAQITRDWKFGARQNHCLIPSTLRICTVYKRILSVLLWLWNQS